MEESTHAERRKHLVRRKWSARLSVAVIVFSTITIAFARYRDEQRTIARERIENHAFGKIGRVIRVDVARHMWEHIFYVPTVATLENEYADESDRRTVRVTVDNWINPNVGDVWEVRLIDPCKKGTCILRLETPLHNYPWRAEWRRKPPVAAIETNPP